MRMSSVYISVFLATFLSQCLVASGTCTGKTAGRGGGKRWAVIVAGAKDYDNYFSQANACHGYQVLRNGGIPAENIIHFNYDDIANNLQNPVKNNLISTLKGSNVYDGCVIDYRREHVTPQVFLTVLTGNKTGVEFLTGAKGKVLESGPDDEVFLYMTDHGDKNEFLFPDDVLTSLELNNALKTMHQRKMYNQMVIYLDACFSGSMFKGLLPKNMGIYAVTSADPKEDGWLSCWDKSRKVFLSTMFSYTWLYTAEKVDRDSESFHQLYQDIYKACTNYSKVGNSHPQEYGNTTFSKYFINRFMGNKKGTNKTYVCKTTPFVVDEKTLTMLETEFKFPFKEDVLSPLFLESPPIDMVSVATVIRRLMSKTLTQDDIESLKAELSYLLNIKIIAQELIMAIEEYVTKTVENSSANMEHVDRIERLDCYTQAKKRIKSRCPILHAQRFPFINRDFNALMNFCEKVGNEILTNAIVASTTKHCSAQ